MTSNKINKNQCFFSNRKSSNFRIPYPSLKAGYQGIYPTYPTYLIYILPNQEIKFVYILQSYARTACNGMQGVFRYMERNVHLIRQTFV